MLQLVKGLCNIECNRAIFVANYLTNSVRNRSWYISSGPGRSKSVLIVEFVPSEVINKILVHYNFKRFSNDTKKTGGSTL